MNASPMAMKPRKSGRRTTSVPGSWTIKGGPKSGNRATARKQKVSKEMAEMPVRGGDPMPPHDPSINPDTKRNIVALTTEERVTVFNSAVAKERKKTQEHGRPVTEYRDGHVVRVWPDGHVEEVPPVEHAD